MNGMRGICKNLPHTTQTPHVVVVVVLSCGGGQCDRMIGFDIRYHRIISNCFGTSGGWRVEGGGAPNKRSEIGVHHRVGSTIFYGRHNADHDGLLALIEEESGSGKRSQCI